MLEYFILQIICINLTCWLKLRILIPVVAASFTKEHCVILIILVIVTIIILFSLIANYNAMLLLPLKDF